MAETFPPDADCPQCGSPDVVYDADEHEYSCRSCGWRTRVEDDESS